MYKNVVLHESALRAAASLYGLFPCSYLQKPEGVGPSGTVVRHSLEHSRGLWSQAQAFCEDSKCS